MRTTIRDVAREAGVSVTTVSHAMNGYPDVNKDTRQRILEVARRLEYVPDQNGRALGGKPQKALAFVLSGSLAPVDPSGMIFGLISGIYEIAQQAGYDFLILTAPEEKQEAMTFMQMCRQKNAAGVIVYGLSMNEKYYTQIEQSEIPCVLVDTDLKGRMNRVVAVDNKRAVYEEVSHMIEQGFRRIAMLAGKNVAYVSRPRMEGYIEALRDHGLPVREEWIGDGSFSETIGEQKAVELKRAYPEIDAFFCASDRMAIGALNGLLKMGLRVPEDVGIAGFDDMPVSKYVHGGITSITQLPYEMGKKSAGALLDLIEGRDVPHWVEVDYCLQKRRSTRAYGDSLEPDHIS